MLWVLHRHLLFSVIFTATWAVVVLSCIMGIINVLKDLLPYLLDGRVPLQMFLHLMGLLFPYIITMTLPVGMLIGVLLVLGRLSADNEVLAMRTAGLSLMRIVWPVLAFSAALVVFGLAANFYFMPRARVAYHADLDNAIRNTALDFIRPRTFVREFQRVVFYCNERNGDVLKDFWLWRLDDRGRVTQLAHAAEARLSVDPEKSLLTLSLKNTQAEDRDEKDPEDFTKAPRLPNAGEATYLLPLESILGKSNRRQRVDWMTFSELQAERERLAVVNASPIERIAPSLQLHSKINTALAIFTFTLVAIPLGIRVQRKETSVNLVVALGVVLAYYFSSLGVGLLEQHPWLRPDLLAWVPNILLGILGLRLIQLVQRV